MDGDGTRDAGEPALMGWTVYLDSDNDGTLDAGEPTQVSNALGHYVFGGLTAGTYTVREVVQSGWARTYPAAGVYTVVLAVGQVAVGKDFGNVQAGQIEGDEWSDLDGDGVRDAGEPGVAGWKVYLDLNNNGQLDPGSTTVEPDNYTSGTVLNTLIPGLTLTAHGAAVTNNQILASTTSYHSTGTMGFANTGSTSWSSGSREMWVDLSTPVSTVSLDAISDDASDIAQLRVYSSAGVLLATYLTPALTAGQVGTMTITRATAEIAQIQATGYGGDVVYLDKLVVGGGAGAEPSATSDASGHYVIGGLAAGTYKVREVQQTGWAQTYPGGDGSHTVAVVAGQVVTGKDFGNHVAPSQLEGDEWSDLDADGVRDAGEPTLTGWTVYLDSDNDGTLDAGEPTQVTNALGHYVFTNLTAGTYTVRQVVQAGWVQTHPGTGTGAEIIAVYDDGTYVDTAGTSSAESDTVQATLGVAGIHRSHVHGDNGRGVHGGSGGRECPADSGAGEGQHRGGDGCGGESGRADLRVGRWRASSSWLQCHIVHERLLERDFRIRDKRRRPDHGIAAAEGCRARRGQSLRTIQQRSQSTMPPRHFPWRHCRRAAGRFTRAERGWRPWR